MRINRLILTNYRRFKSLDINFHPKLTVLVARNGYGKTAVLEAITSAFGTFTGAFDLGKARHIEHSDVRMPPIKDSTGATDSEPMYPVKIEAWGEFEGDVQHWFRELTGPKNKTTIKHTAPITNYGKSLQNRIRDEKDLPLPLIAYYGTSRLWQTHRFMTRKKVIRASRSIGYEDCFSSASNYKQLQQWFRKASLALLQEQQLDGEKKEEIGNQLSSIRTAVDTVLQAEGWHNLHYNLALEDMAMRHREYGVLPVALLSDGVRSIVTLTADIAFRCTKLNPQFAQYTATKTTGIVLIDEVDMHLHPSWQQRVVSGLCDAFPCLQFIVTTHSPQVLSTVKRENIRLFDINADGIDVAAIPLATSYGEPSSTVLQAVMDVDPQPPVPEKGDLDKLTELMEQGLYDTEEAKKLLEQLKQSLDSTHPQLRRIERSIRRIAMLGL